MLTPRAGRPVSSGAKLFDSWIGSSRRDEGWPDRLTDLLHLENVQSPMGRGVELNICPLDLDRSTPPNSSASLLYEEFKIEIRFAWVTASDSPVRIHRSGYNGSASTEPSHPQRGGGIGVGVL
jgi:hypothetical protein